MTKRGFTLIELLIVIGIIAILMALVIAVNPAKQFAQARNTQRWAHINSILSVVYQNMVDNGGNFTCVAGALPASATNMAVASGNYNICSCLVPTYVAAMPFDPTTGSYTSCTTYDSKYTVMQDATTKRITVAAPDAELSATISMTR